MGGLGLRSSVGLSMVERLIATGRRMGLCWQIRRKQNEGWDRVHHLVSATSVKKALVKGT